AEAAVAESVPDGYYALGRIAEETGNLPEAIKQYRAANKAHGGKADEAGSRYRIALARVLIKSKAGEKIAVPGNGKARSQSSKRVGWTKQAFVSLLLTLQAGLPLTGEEIAEAEKLADEVLKMGDKAPFDVRAQALAVKGLYTEALKEYTAGLGKKGLLAPAYA